ncbi:MAG: TRAP transporter substrate-binding protein DctP [Thermodesulfobacteriota bacterium]
MVIPRKLKRIILFWGVFFWMLLPLSVTAGPVQVKIATLAPEGSPWLRTFNRVDAELKKKTNNQVQLKVYPGGVLGDERDMLRKMHIEQIHGAVLTSSTLSIIFPEIKAFQAPFLFQTSDEVDYVLKKMDGFFRNGIDKKGFQIMGWSEGGFVRLMSTIPVDTLEKIKKAKVWIWEDAPMARAIFNEAGVSAIPLSVPDVLVGLQTGMVDVVYAPPSGAIALQWFTKTKFMNDVPLIYLMGGIVIKNSFMKKLSPAQQGLLAESFNSHMDGLQAMVRRQNEDAMKVMADYGVKTLKVPDDEVEQFKDLAAKALQKMMGSSFSPQTLNALKEHLAVYRRTKKP